jgi:hypothetical protein
MKVCVNIKFVLESPGNNQYQKLFCKIKSACDELRVMPKFAK